MHEVIKSYIEDGSYGDLHLSFNLCPELKELPDNLLVRGKLFLRNSYIKALPKGLHVIGNIDLSGTIIKELPTDIKIGGSIDLTHSKIERLPENLEVRGNLYLSGAYKLKELPKGLKVRGYLFMENGPKIKTVEELPDDLEVGGKILSDYFTDAQFREHAKFRDLRKKLPELEGLI